MSRFWWKDGAAASEGQGHRAPPHDSENAEPSRFSGHADAGDADLSRFSGHAEAGDADLSRFSGHAEAGDGDLSRFSGRFAGLAAEDMELPVPDELRPNAGIRVRRRRRLQLIAAQHGGCFTVADTRDAGYDRRARHHHLSYGNWRRTDAPGVYRLTGWPDDPAEPFHAWLLWAGRGAELTSWTALGVQGVLERSEAPRVAPDTPDLPPDASSPVHVVMPSRPRRPERSRNRGAPAVRVHPSIRPALPSPVVNGLPVRSVEESLCIALKTSFGSAADYAEVLTERLLDAGDVDLHTLLDTARHCRAIRMLDLLWPRLRRPGAGRRTKAA